MYVHCTFSALINNVFVIARKAVNLLVLGLRTVLMKILIYGMNMACHLE